MGLVVETKYGKVEGFSEEGINKWLGIPYAKPPIGKLRFKRTEKCVPWAGVKETKNHGNKPREVYKLKTLHPDEMKHAAEYLLFNNCNLYPGIFLPGPVIDDLIPEHPIDAISKGCAKDIKLIIGTNDDDGALFVKVETTMFPSSWEQVRKMLELNHCIDKLEDLHQLYDGLSENKQMKELAKDRAFLIYSIKVADRQSGYNSTWMYRFDYAPILTRLVGLKSVHGVEVPIALDNLGRGVIRRFWKGAPKKVMYKLRDDMHTAWVNFAKNSVPNRDLDMYWPNYNAEIRATFIFNENNRVVMNPSEKNYEVWKDIKLYID